MPSQTKGSIRNTSVSPQDSSKTLSKTPRPRGVPAPRESAFSALFLERARRREDAAELAESTLARLAGFAGRWEVEEVPAGRGVLWAVVRRDEPAREGGGARLAFLRRQEAQLAAAALAALAAPNHLALNERRKSRARSGLGQPVHDGARHLGHASPALVPLKQAFLAAYHAVRCLAANPEAAALFVEALDLETLALLGRAILRRVG
jgi:hypothetical protein